MICLVSKRLFTVLFLPLILLGIAGCGGGYGSKVENGNIEVYYLDGATKDEAERLAAYLNKEWGEGDRRSVQIKKSGDGYQFRMVVKKEFQNDEKMLQLLAFTGARISRDVFNGAAVEVHSCDEHLKTLKTFPHRDDIRHGLVEGKVELFYSPAVDKADAEKLLNYLSKAMSNATSLITFKMALRDPVIEVHLVTASNVMSEPATVAGLRQARKEIADNVFPGKQVELHLCDDRLNVLEVLKP